MNQEVTKYKIFLKTYGCQMNEYDSELLRSILEDEGFVFVENALEADIVLLNTCAVRENAHRKVYGRVHEIRHKRKGHPVMIGILGCMATALRQELLDDSNLNIDFIVGPDSYKRLPELIEKAVHQKEKAFDISLSELETYQDIYPTRTRGVNAWVAIMRGCNNFCTFCIVPYTRGRERSRSADDILTEVRRLVSEGFKQVTLLGQNVNSYTHNGATFTDLLEKISAVEGLERIRFVAPHPKDFPEKLIDLVANNSKICKHIHLPLQAGNNRVLKMMNRKYTKEVYLELRNKLRNSFSGITLTTDIIVGFPTETDKEFEDTVSVMRTVQFDSAFIFKYSERKGTIASKKYPDDVPEEKKTERIVRLNDLQKNISLKKNQAHIGEIHEILIENEETTRTKDKFQGRNDGNKIVTIPAGPYSQGQFIKVKITAATPHVLRGERVGSK